MIIGVSGVALLFLLVELFIVLGILAASASAAAVIGLVGFAIVFLLALTAGYVGGSFVRRGP
jgi:hypothetical protein